MKRFSGYFLLIAFLFFLSLIFYSIDEIFISRTLAEAKKIEIKKGEGAGLIIKRLKDEGLVRNKLIVRAYVILMGIHKEIKPGLYSISPVYSVSQIFEEFTVGNGTEVRIFEGYTNKEISEALKEKGIINNLTEFQRLASNFDNSDGRYNFLSQKKGINLEGYLFPDTYEFGGLSSEEIIEKMLDNFGKRVYSRLNNLSGKKFDEAVIMASMLEKEVRTEKDMKIVSGILWKRLEAGAPLQVDAALVYIKCSLLNQKNCRTLADGDKKLNSPYNTYINSGLSPTPISNPGLKAIEAALNPELSPYWYYLSSRNDGKTIFSRTLNEHNLNKTVYR